MGGAPVADSRRTSTRWTTKHVVRSKSLATWTTRTPYWPVTARLANRNVAESAAGRFTSPTWPCVPRALVGGQHGHLVGLHRGTHAVRFNTQTAAAFAQAQLLRRPRSQPQRWTARRLSNCVWLSCLRRVVAGRTMARVGVRAGVGMFVQRVPERMFFSVPRDDGLNLRQFIATDASLTGSPFASTFADALTSIRSRTADDW